MNTELLMTEEKLNAAANKLRNYLTARGTNVNDIDCLDSPAKRLEAVSQIFFGRPYDDLHALLKDTDVPLNPAHAVSKGGSVLVLSVGSNILLGQDGHYIAATNPGTDMEISWPALRSQGQALAYVHQDIFREYAFPDSMASVEVEDDYEYIKLAEELGLFSEEPCLAWELMQVRRASRVWANDACAHELRTPEDMPRPLTPVSEHLEEHPMFEIILENDVGSWNYTLTAQDLAGAQYLGDNAWELNCEQAPEEPVTIQITAT